MTEPTPHLVIRPPRRWAPLNLREVWEFRDLLVRFTIRDLKLRYKQTALGVIWVVLQPLLAAGIFSFVFGRVADLPSEGVPYFVFAYVGMMCWTVFSATLGKISGSLVGNAQLISKIFFPRLVLPLSTVGSTLVDFGVALAMGIVVLIVGGVAPGVAVLTLPLWLLLAFLLAAGLGLVAAALMVPYRDVQYILPVATQLLLYGTPIAYAFSAVPDGARWAVNLNPLTGILEGFRWSLMQTPAPSTPMVVWSASAAVVAFLGGSLVFTRMERKFADVI
jgi:lipopolysaccharide transport system permease protein